jgi:hypothetical protein
MHHQALAWNQRRLEELASPLEPSDTWVHTKVLEGRQRGFITLKDCRRL